MHLLNRLAHNNTRTSGKSLIPIIALLLALFGSGCSNDAFFEEFSETREETWNMDDHKEFQVKIVDHLASYRLIFTIRNTTNYPYSNLYMFFTTIHPDNTATRDTIECLLADRSGRWLGKGTGRIRESRFLIREQFAFPDTGDYRFILEQAMRDEKLNGITDIGLRLEQITLSK